MGKKEGVSVADEIRATIDRLGREATPAQIRADLASRGIQAAPPNISVVRKKYLAKTDEEPFLDPAEPTDRQEPGTESPARPEAAVGGDMPAYVRAPKPASPDLAALPKKDGPVVSRLAGPATPDLAALPMKGGPLVSRLAVFQSIVNELGAEEAKKLVDLFAGVK